MQILDQIMSWGMVFLSWYVVYVLVAGAAFAAWLVYRLWGPDILKGKPSPPGSAPQRRVD